MKKLLFQLLFFFFFPASFFAQKMDHTNSFRNIQSSSYLRLNYDNDLFTSTDQNYTQGIKLEFVIPVLKKNPLNFLLLKTKSSDKRYGLALEHACYTPGNIASTEIQSGDRPFAAAFFLKNFLIADDTSRKSRLVSSLSFGVIGLAAFGNEMQTTIHKTTKNILPGGWHNQVRNDLVLNYALSYEKRLLYYRNLFSLQSNSGIQLGTLFTNASLGFNTQFGRINLPFSSTKNQFQMYAYFQVLLNVIAYDATIRGGLLNDESVYVIPSKDLKRLTLQYNYGLVLQTKKFYLEFGLTNLSGEIENVRPTGWGGVKLGFGF